MVWLVNMADTDRPKRNSTEAASPQPETQEGEWGVWQSGMADPGGWVVTFSKTLVQKVWLLFNLTGITCLQLWRLRLPPVHHRTTEASPRPGSATRSTSWGRSSQLKIADGRSSRCPPLVLLTTMTRRVSANICFFLEEYTLGIQTRDLF